MKLSVLAAFLGVAVVVWAFANARPQQKSNVHAKSAIASKIAAFERTLQLRRLKENHGKQIDAKSLSARQNINALAAKKQHIDVGKKSLYARHLAAKKQRIDVGKKQSNVDQRSFVCTYTCGNGNGINCNTTCNGVDDCADCSDEIGCDPPSTADCPGYIPCNNGAGSYLISQRCDLVNDCPDGSDEDDGICTPDSGTGDFWPGQPPPSISYMPCNNGGDTYLISQQCDYFNDCPDGSDEEDEKCMSSCTDQNKKYHKSKNCDRIRDCDDGSDENWCMRSCANMNGMYHVMDYCNGIPDCDDWSDEQAIGCIRTPDSGTGDFWPGPTTPSTSIVHCDGITQYRCSNMLQCIPIGNKCDGNHNCHDKSDEVEGCLTTPGTSIVHCDGITQYRCSNMLQCIPIGNKCDGNHNCQDKSDEVEGCLTTPGTSIVHCDGITQYRCSNMLQCIPIGNKCDGTPECWDKSDEVEGCTPDSGTGDFWPGYAKRVLGKTQVNAKAAKRNNYERILRTLLSKITK